MKYKPVYGLLLIFGGASVAVVVRATTTIPSDIVAFSWLMVYLAVLMWSTAR